MKTTQTMCMHTMTHLIKFHQSALIASALIITSISLCGCGQSGPLYYPKKTNAQPIPAHSSFKEVTPASSKRTAEHSFKSHDGTEHFLPPHNDDKTAQDNNLPPHSIHPIDNNQPPQSTP